MKVCSVVVGFGCTFAFWVNSRFLSKGNTGTFKPLFALSSHAVGGPFVVLFASEDEFRQAYEVSPSFCVVM